MVHLCQRGNVEDMFIKLTLGLGYDNQFLAYLYQFLFHCCGIVFRHILGHEHPFRFYPNSNLGLAMHFPIHLKLSLPHLGLIMQHQSCKFNPFYFIMNFIIQLFQNFQKRSNFFWNCVIFAKRFLGLNQLINIFIKIPLSFKFSLFYGVPQIKAWFQVG